VGLVDRIETVVDGTGNGVWSTVELATFLNEAIREYSEHFPRGLRVEIGLTAGVWRYDLPAGCLRVLEAAYPAGAFPPRYLRRWQRERRDFWLGGCYDVFEGDRHELIVGDAVADGEGVAVVYEGLHELIEDVEAIGGFSSVPGEHEDLLVKYVIWRCSAQLQKHEEQSPTSGSSLLMSQYASNARRDRQAYEGALAQALYAREGRSVILSWHTGSGGRVY